MPTSLIFQHQIWQTRIDRTLLCETLGSSESDDFTCSVLVLEKYFPSHDYLEEESVSHAGWGALFGRYEQYVVKVTLESAARLLVCGREEQASAKRGQARHRNVR